NSRHLFERFTGLRNLSIMLVDKETAGSDGIFRLHAVEADTLNVLLESGRAERKDRLGCVGSTVKLARGNVDAFIGRLRRQNHCDEQLERGPILELRTRIGIRLAKPRETGHAL